MRLAKIQLFDEPVVLIIPIVILASAKGMGDLQRMSSSFPKMTYSLHTIDNRAGKVVGRVHFPLVAGAIMRQQVAAVNDGVAQRLVLRVDTDLGAQAAFQTLYP